MEDILEAAISDLKATFVGQENTKELISRIEEIMPIESQKYEVVNVTGNDVRFKATIKTKSLKDEGDIENFVKNYGIKNGETLRISKTKKLPNTRGEYYLIKYFRCQHYTRYESTKCPGDILATKPNKRFKNTNCPFSLVVRIGKNAQSADFYSTINIEWNHNHAVEALHSLTFKDIPTPVVDKILDMFDNGLLPAAAYQEFLRQLRSECGDDLEYHKRLSDRSQAPRRKDFNDIYTSFKKERFGAASLADMFCALEERVKSLQEKDDDYTVQFQKFDEEINQPFILVVITPLMKRVHKLVCS